MKRKVIFVTGGDPSGIGGCTFLLALQELINERMRIFAADSQQSLTLVVLACSFSLPIKELQRLFGELGFPRFLSFDCVSNLQEALTAGESLKDREIQEQTEQGKQRDGFANSVFFYDLTKEERIQQLAQQFCGGQAERGGQAEQGGYEIMGGVYAIRALFLACHLSLRVDCVGMCTLPLSKGRVCRALGALENYAGFSKRDLQLKNEFIDHTGYLADFFACPTRMLMLGDRLSVLLLTSHLPLRFVPEGIRETLADDTLLSVFAQICREFSEEFPSPWAICGLNPHAGENGFLGSEEKDWLIPWLRTMHSRFPEIEIQGPFSADALFSIGQRDKYRLIIAQYHDQGLIPFKALEGMQGINCTLGLPFLRTSPAHGTAFGLPREEISCESTLRAFKILLVRFQKLVQYESEKEGKRIFLRRN